MADKLSSDCVIKVLRYLCEPGEFWHLFSFPFAHLDVHDGEVKSRTGFTERDLCLVHPPTCLVVINNDGEIKTNGRQDIITFSSTCKYLRTLILNSDACSPYWQNIDYSGDSVESFFYFLRKISATVKVLEFDYCEKLGIEERVWDICPIMPNVHSLAIYPATFSDRLPLRFPALTKLDMPYDKDTLQFITNGWTTLLVANMSSYDGPVDPLLSFLQAQPRLKSVILPEEDIGVFATDDYLVRWLSTPARAEEIIQLEVKHSISDREILRGVALCENIEILEVAATGLTDAALAPLGRLANLLTLTISGDASSNITENGLCNLFETADFSLICLNLTADLSSDRVIQTLISNHPALTGMSVRGDLSVDAFKDINTLHELDTLICYSHKLPVGMVAALDPVSLPKLRKLEMYRMDDVDNQDPTIMNELWEFQGRFPGCSYIGAGSDDLYPEDPDESQYHRVHEFSSATDSETENCKEEL